MDETLVRLSNYEMHCTTNRKHQKLQESLMLFKMFIILGICLCTSLCSIFTKRPVIEIYQTSTPTTHISKIKPSTTIDFRRPIQGKISSRHILQLQ
jgi:hypothetical protein